MGLPSSNTATQATTAGRIQVGARSVTPAAQARAEGGFDVGVRGFSAQSWDRAPGSRPPGQHPSPQRRLPASAQSLPHGSSRCLLRPSQYSVSQASRRWGGKVGRRSSGSRTAALSAVVSTAAAAAATLPGNGSGGDAAAMLTSNRRRVLRDGDQGLGAVPWRQPIGGADPSPVPPPPAPQLPSCPQAAAWKLASSGTQVLSGGRADLCLGTWLRSTSLLWGCFRGGTKSDERQWDAKIHRYWQSHRGDSEMISSGGNSG